MYRVERQRTRDGFGMGVKYGSYSHRETLEEAKQYARNAAASNATAMQYGRYVVLDEEDNEVFAVSARPAFIPDVEIIEEDCE